MLVTSFCKALDVYVLPDMSSNHRSEIFLILWLQSRKTEMITYLYEEHMEPTEYSFEELLRRTHKEGVGLFDYNDMKIPCIFVKQRTFDEILRMCYGKPALVDANMNVLHDDKKHVFVEIMLNFKEYEQSILLYANDTLEFFKRLAESGIIAFAPEGSQQTGNIFMVQLPRRDALEKVLKMINLYLK